LSVAIEESFPPQAQMPALRLAVRDVVQRRIVARFMAREERLLPAQPIDSVKRWTRLPRFRQRLLTLKKFVLASR
jgi:hypothetical protein